MSQYSGAEVACGPAGGCELVLTSRWATIGGVPIAAVGAAYYALASVLAWTPAESWGRRTSWALVLLTGTGFIFSAVLFWLQAAVIDAWCRFCLVSAAITTLLFLSAVTLHFTSGRPAR